MPLKLELKAGERLRLGDFVVVNEGGRTKLCIEGDAPVLRERDMLPPEAARSPAERLYLAMQSMYLSGRRDPHHGEYRRLAGEILAREPGARPLLEAIEGHVSAGHLYRAMRDARQLICRAGGVWPAVGDLARTA